MDFGNTLRVCRMFGLGQQGRAFLIARQNGLQQGAEVGRGFLFDTGHTCAGRKADFASIGVDVSRYGGQQG